MKKAILIIVGVVVLLLLFVFSWYIKGVNRIVRLHEKTSEAWAQIDTQLQRRADLIPNIVETVKGYAAHEKKLFTDIAKSRASYAGANTINDKVSASREMNSLLSRLLVVVERYPDLKANQSFQMMMTELEGTENRIAVARMRYNKDVKAFNTYIREFFGSFFAGRRGLEDAIEYFEVKGEAPRSVPKIKFT